MILTDTNIILSVMWSDSGFQFSNFVLNTIRGKAIIPMFVVQEVFSSAWFRFKSIHKVAGESFGKQGSKKAFVWARSDFNRVCREYSLIIEDEELYSAVSEIVCATGLDWVDAELLYLTQIRRDICVVTRDKELQHALLDVRKDALFTPEMSHDLPIDVARVEEDKEEPPSSTYRKSTKTGPITGFKLD